MKKEKKSVFVSVRESRAPLLYWRRNEGAIELCGASLATLVRGRPPRSRSWFVLVAVVLILGLGPERVEPRR